MESDFEKLKRDTIEHLSVAINELYKVKPHTLATRFAYPVKVEKYLRAVRELTELVEAINNSHEPKL